MPIERLLRKPVQTLPPGGSCREAARVMRDHNVGSVVVSDEGRPLGLVTDRDLAIRVLAAGEDPDRLTIREVMSGDPIFLGEERPLEQAFSVMRDLGVRRLPVVDRSSRLRGVVSLDDLLVLLAEQLGDLAEVVRKELTEP